MSATEAFLSFVAYGLVTAVPTYALLWPRSFIRVIIPREEWPGAVRTILRNSASFRIVVGIIAIVPAVLTAIYAVIVFVILVV